MRAAVIRRFYKTVGIAESADAFVLTLDGRQARTPKKRPLAMPTPGLAANLAAEWDGQGDAIKPADMPFTRLANAAIDGVADTMEATRATMATYAEELGAPDATEGDLRNLQGDLNRQMVASLGKRLLGSESKVMARNFLSKIKTDVAPKVAEYYQSSGFSVEILTGDRQLKSLEPARAPLVPRRRAR